MEAAIKKIPYGMTDFESIIRDGYYYVDKTQYIEKVENISRFFFFVRPRRFGKSLLISMLAHYYDRTKANRFEELFGGTWIGEHPTEEHNQYLVIRYDFSAMVMADDMEGVVQNFNDLNCGPVEVTVEHNRDLFGDFQFTTRGNAVQMLEELLGYISSHGLPKAYILIDEYDNFTNQLLTSYNDSLYEEVTTSDSFLLTFFKVIKAGIGEGTIRTCFCTGVLPVIMDDLTSGYNIAEILKQFEEQEILLSDEGLEQMKNDCLDMLKAIIWMLDGAKYLWQGTEKSPDSGNC